MNPRLLTASLGLGLIGLFPIVISADPSPASNRAPSALAAPVSSASSLLKECRSLAKRKIPYVFGGNSVLGMDCSASVQRLYRSLGVPLPRTSEGQANALAQRGQLWQTRKGESEKAIFARLQPGDLVFWVKDASPNRVSHVMVFVGMDGDQARLWGARGTGKTGLTGSGVDFFHYPLRSGRNRRIVAHGNPSRG